MAYIIITTHPDGGEEYVHNASRYPANEDSVLAKGYGVTANDPAVTEMQFNKTARYWNNQNKNQFIHLTFSFEAQEAPDAHTAMKITDNALSGFKDDHLMLVGIHGRENEKSDFHSHSFIHTTNYRDGSMIYADNNTLFPVAQSVADQTGEKCVLVKKKENNMKKEFRKTFYPHK